MKKNHDFSLTPTWPDSLPEHCPCCNHTYDIRSSLEIGPGAAGRCFRRIAPWMTVVTLVLMFLSKLSFLELGGWGGAMAFAVALILPSITLWIIGGLLPTKARLFCFRCNTSSFHRVPRKIDNRIQVVSE